VGKTLWIVDHYALSPDMSGITRDFDLSKQLVEKGHKVTIFASAFDHVSKTYAKLDADERIKIEVYDGVQFVWLRTFPYYRNDFRRIMNMISYSVQVKRYAVNFGKPDTIIGVTVHPLAALAAWRLSRKLKAPFFLLVTDLWPEALIDLGFIKKGSLVSRLLYGLESFLCSKAEKIIVVLPYGVEYMTRRGIEREKVFWLPNGVDLERFKNPRSPNRNYQITQLLEKNRDKFKVVYAGAHGIPNGLDVVLDAAKLIKEVTDNICFFFVGEGTEKQRLRKRAKELHLDNVMFCDAVPKIDMPSILSQADCLVVSVPGADFPRFGISLNKLFDYMASARPIVMAGMPRNNLVAEANCGIVVEPDNPNDLAKGILRIWELSENERQQLGMNGRRFVEKYYDVEVLADRLEAILGWGTEGKDTSVNLGNAEPSCSHSDDFLA